MFNIIKHLILLSCMGDVLSVKMYIRHFDAYELNG